MTSRKKKPGPSYGCRDVGKLLRMETSPMTTWATVTVMMMSISRQVKPQNADDNGSM